MAEEELEEQVLRALAAWQIPVIRLNGMLAERLGMTWTDLQALYVLANRGAASPGELARQVNLTSGAASRMIDRLERAGYVRRAPDPHDRRRVVIEADPDAVARVGGLYDELNAAHRRDLGELRSADLRALLRFLEAATRSTEDEIRRLADS